MANSYQRLPQSDDPSPSSPSRDPSSPPAPHPETANHDPSDPSYRPLRASIRSEFNRPPPATWKRVLLVLAIFVMGYIAVRLGGMGGTKKPQVIYASRYSEEHKYRPAASPVITEHLKDGRIRLRGASPGGVGVREEDLPMSRERKAVQEKKRVEEAKAEAARKVKERKAAVKERRKAARAAGKERRRSGREI